MKHYIYLCILLFWTTFSFGQLVQRNAYETAEQFSERLKPENATLTHKVLEMKWNDLPVIISFYKQSYKLPIQNDPGQQTYIKIVGTVFIQLDKNSYAKTTFRSIDTEGSEPKIETVFFANADRDKSKELVIIASWGQQHSEVNGTLYGTFIFDYDLTSGRYEWRFLEKLSRKLNGGCECSWSDGSIKKAKFKTASEVKRELSRLGFE